MARNHEKKVHKLLEKYYEINERQYYKGEYSVTEDLVDLERAIASADLTERQRACLRLVYLKDLTHAEAGLRLGIERSTVSHANNAAVRKIAKYYDRQQEEGTN